MPRNNKNGWQWREFSRSNKHWGKGIRGEWYKQAPLKVAPQPKQWINPYVKKEFTKHIAMPVISHAQRMMFNHAEAVARRAMAEAYRLAFGKKPKYPIVTKKSSFVVKK